MSRDLEDARARAEALDPHRSFIVQAPAGSGKTGLLVQRFLRLLARVERPEEVVAVTFTRKAAAEMRHRVQDALMRAEEGGAGEESPYQRTTLDLAREVLRRDGEWQLRKHPERFRIATIDSLCASLARAAPLLSGAGGGLRPVSDAQPLYREAARATFGLLEEEQRWSGPVAALLLHLDNDWARAETLLTAMLARREQWLRWLAGPDLAEAREQLEESLFEVVRQGLEEADALFSPGEKLLLPRLLAFAAETLARTRPEASLACCRGLTAFPEPTPERHSLWLALCDLLLTGAGEVRRRLTVTEGFPPKCPEKALLLSLLQTLEARPAFADTLARVRLLPPVRYREEQWTLLAGLMELLRLSAAQLRLVFARRGEVDFVEVAQRADLALGTPEEPTDLGLYLDYRIRHLLVDEFQDTSLSQYRLLERLMAGWEPGDGRTLFLVGDPMQSIYRFREAEVGLFLRARREGMGGIDLVPLTLTVNFRSDARVVGWVNRLFPAIFPARESVEEGAVSFSSSFPSRGEEEGGGVFFHPHDGSGEAAEVLAVARQSLARGWSVAVLARARNHLAGILAAFRRGGVPIRAVEVEGLGERPAIRDLFALTCALAHPADVLHQLAVLAAPWCGLSRPDLLAFRGGEGEISGDGRARLTRVMEIMDRARRERQRKPLRDWVEGAWLALGGPDAYPCAEELAGVPAFFQLLAESEVEGLPPPAGVLAEALERIRVSPPVAVGAAVSLMTMHKAKGLEFDVVLLPGLERGERADAARLLLWLQRPLQGLLLGPVQATGEEKDPIYRYLETVEREKSRHERARLLYVAATRARRRLHLFGRVEEARVASSGSFLAQLRQAAGEKEVAPAFPGMDRADPAAERSPAPAPGRLPADYRPPLPLPDLQAQIPRETVDEEPVEFKWVGELLKKVGSVVHFGLCLVAREGVEAWDRGRLAGMAPRFRARLRQLGVPREEMGRALARVMDALERSLADARGQWLLSGRHREAEGEAPYSGVVAGHTVHAVLDRTFIDREGVRWIVDYKTSFHEGGELSQFLDNERERYQKQLQRYAALMTLREPGRPIRLGLYFPLLSDWREWPHDG